MRTDVYCPVQGFEEQASIVALDFWRAGTRAYERDAEPCSLNLYFLVHVCECVMMTVTRDGVKLCSTDGTVELLLQVPGFTFVHLEVRGFACRRLD